MGRDAAITYEQVTAAADAAKSAGSKPTSRGIRERLGNVGSMGTINRLLQRWRANQDYQVTPAVVLPAALQRAILTFMDEELTRMRATLEDEMGHYQQEATDLAVENERQLETIDAQVEQMAALAAARAAADGKAVQLAADLDKAREEAARERVAAELARIELAKAQLRLETLPRMENDLAALGHELEQERLMRISAEQNAAVLIAQKADLEGRLADGKAQLGHAHEQIVRVQERAERLATALDGERKARIEAEQASAVLTAQKADLDSRVADFKTLARHTKEQLGKAKGGRRPRSHSQADSGPEGLSD
jgi:chromosome segregation ATPase